MDGPVACDFGDGPEATAAAGTSEGIDGQRAPQQLGPVQPGPGGQQRAVFEAIEVPHADYVDAVEDVELDAGGIVVR